MVALKDKLKLWAEKFSEAWTACMICMVQGDITVLTVSHALTASKTGALAGLGCVLASFIPSKRNKTTDALLTGAVTMAADIAVHPTHFGPQMAEAALTGVVAATICYLVGRK